MWDLVKGQCSPHNIEACVNVWLASNICHIVYLFSYVPPQGSWPSFSGSLRSHFFEDPSKMLEFRISWNTKELNTKIKVPQLEAIRLVGSHSTLYTTWLYYITSCTTYVQS